MKEDNTKTAVIILNWNGKRDTISCIHSIFESQDEAFDIIIVDNGSSDDSITILKKTFPTVIIIENKKNLGFSGGMNKGLNYCQKADYPFVLLLNNDTLFLQKGILSAYRTILEKHPEIGAVTARISIDKNGYHNQKEIIADSSTISKQLYTLFCPPYHPPLKSQTFISNDYSITYVPMIHGVAIGLRKDVIKQVKSFNEDFFCYEEDRDFLIRIRNLGFQLAILDDYWIYHKWSISSSQMSPFKIYYKSRNLWFMRHRYQSKRYIIYAYIRLFGVSFKNNLILYFYRGFKDALSGKIGNTFGKNVER